MTHLTEPTGCIAEVCLGYGTWAEWFAGAGAILAVVVALSAFFVTEAARRRDVREAGIRTGQLIGVKLYRVMNNTMDLHRHLWAAYEGPPLGFAGKHEIWRTIHPLLGVRFNNSLELDGDEVSLLIQMSEANFLTELILATDRYHSIVDCMAEYGHRRDLYQEALPPPKRVDGRIVQIALSEQEFLSQQPYSEQLEFLAVNLREMTQENVAALNRLAERFHPMMKAYFKGAKFILILPLTPPSA